MSKIEVCGGCGGKGYYFVFNAYDPKVKEEVLCEHCNTDGRPPYKTSLEKDKSIKKALREDWSN